MISCGGHEFIVTVDMAGQVRMLYLNDLERQPSKFSNLVKTTQDNSTWSVDGAQVNPPRVAVGSNTHKVTVYDLSSSEKHTINAHQHNVPCVSFSPCGRFLATTSIDKTLKVWEERAGGVYKCARVTIPSADWGWAVQWIDKTKCEIQLVSHDTQDQSRAHPLQKQTDDALRELIGNVRSGNPNLLGRDVFEMITTL